MARKAVYGKKKNKALTASIAKFDASSSPTRSPPAAKQEDDIAELTNGLKNVDLENESDTKRPKRKTPRTRKALKPRDKNVEAIRAQEDEPEVLETKEAESIKPTESSLVDDSKTSQDGSHIQPSNQSTPPSSPVLRTRRKAQAPGIEESPPQDRTSRSHISLISVLEDSESDDSSSSIQSTVSVSSHPEAEYTRPLLQYCRDPQGRKEPSKFQEWSDTLRERLNICKIAEASYGEVYRLSVRGPSSLTRSDESVLKLIPLRPSYLSELSEEDQMDYEWMSTIASVTSEVQLLQRMASTPGFTNFREIRVVQGRPSKFFCKAWSNFNRAQPEGGKSQFPNPNKYDSYASDQLWAVIEMQDAGTDLEHVPIKTPWALWDVFWGVTLALAKAEQCARFEHRDLHLGNICVRPRTTSSKPFAPLSYRGKLSFTNLETTIIDYTLSRADLTPPSPVPVAYLDLDADPAVFEGDADEEYQYEIYRYMRAAFFANDPNAELTHPDVKPKRKRKCMPRSWEEYNPTTNVVWLHFILHTLLKHLPTYEDSTDDEDLRSQAALGEKQYRIVYKADLLHRRLLKLDKALDFRRTDRSDDERFESASQIVEWAVMYHWLEDADVLGDIEEARKKFL